jgi:hypothetical protein
MNQLDELSYGEFQEADIALDAGNLSQPVECDFYAGFRIIAGVRGFL